MPKLKRKSNDQKNAAAKDLYKTNKEYRERVKTIQRDNYVRKKKNEPVSIAIVRERNRSNLASYRDNNLYKEKEREKNQIHIKNIRKDLPYKLKENEKNNQRISNLRKDSIYKEKEIEKNNLRISRYRGSSEFRQKEKELKNNSRNNYEALVSKYLIDISDSCDKICSFCEGLWFFSSVTFYTEAQLKAKGEAFFVFIQKNSRIFDREKRYCFCDSCKRSLFRKTVNLLMNFIKNKN